ncbi:hypothetical protein DYH09_00660 [bacterium CPR1]|nr:hypothetical protein [bacterium CPR1]
MNGNWADHAGHISRQGLERMSQSYWLNSTQKRLAAAEETLDQLDRLDPRAASPARLMRQVALTLPGDQRVEILRAGLRATADGCANLAAGSTFPLIGLALALSQARPEAGQTVLEELASESADPVVALLAERRLGQPGLATLQALCEGAEARARACGQGKLWQLDPDSRLAVARQVAGTPGLKSPLLERLSRLEGSTATMLESALAAHPGGELQIGAAALQEAPEKLQVALVELTRPHLPADWAGLVNELEPASQGVEERARLGAVAIALAAGQQPGSLLALAAGLRKPSESLARELLQRLPGSPALSDWQATASLLKLTPPQVLEGVLELESTPRAELVEHHLSTPEQAALLIRAEASRATGDRASFLAGLEACGGVRAAYRAALGPTPSNLSELMSAFLPVLAESDAPLQTLARALPHWSSLAANADETTMLTLLESSCTGELYEPPTVWKGVEQALKLVARQPDCDLANFSYSLVVPMRFWMDGSRVGAEALAALCSRGQAERQTALATVAGFLHELQDQIADEHERHAIITVGLGWLASNTPSVEGLGKLARALRKETKGQHTDLVTGGLAARHLAAQGSPALSQQGRFLAAVAAMRSENLPERLEAVSDGLDRVAADASLALIASAVAARFKESPLERQKVARLCFAELAASTSDPRQSAAFSTLSQLVDLSLPQPQGGDLAVLLLEQMTEPPDPARLGSVVAQALLSLDQESQRQAAPLLFDGLERTATAWGDRKLLPPLVARARAEEDLPTSLSQLSNQLAGYQGESYWLVGAAQGVLPGSSVEERSAHVIVGGVAVRKNQSQD